MRPCPGLAVGLAALCVGGCGGGQRSAATGACAAAARAVIAAASGTPAARVAATAFVAPSGAAGCRFAARGVVPIAAVAGIDTAPQASVRFEREVVEYGQNVIWAHRGPSPYPRNIDGLGQGADWFPAERRLLATDGGRLVEVTVTWPGAAAGRELRLAESIVRGYVARR